MEIRYCSRCKKMFQYVTGIPLCPECKAQDEKDFESVKKYLKENPRAPLGQIAEELDIPADKITRFLKEGRLEIAPGGGIELECERCGEPIRSGRFCSKCSSTLENNLKEGLGRNTSSSQMHFLRDDK